MRAEDPRFQAMDEIGPTTGQPAPRRAGLERRRGGARRALAVAALVAVSAYAGGFLVFADHVANARSPETPKADGIVALTGGAQRIEDAAALLGRGSASRLLISGVHEDTTGGALAGRSPQLARLMRCCVDLGHEAHDTRGNALETGEWARRRGYDSLIVVTSAYHMPRSLAEIGRELPDVELVPYPVNPDGRDYAGWPGNPDLIRLLLVEYTKYILARFG
jgi:uncharacterized SAM-binding protein YcdF (DUF218 family)